jgi:hypothetical protein
MVLLLTPASQALFCLARTVSTALSKTLGGLEQRWIRMPSEAPKQANHLGQSAWRHLSREIAIAARYLIAGGPLLVMGYVCL